MVAICNGTDLSSMIAQGFQVEYTPQYGASMTAMDGTDYTAKLRDRVTLTCPFIPLTLPQLTTVLQLFPQGAAYVSWTYYDPYLAAIRTIQGKYEARTSSLKCVFKDGTEYYSGLVIKLTER